MPYFDHFADISPTRIGNWLVRGVNQKTFDLLVPLIPDHNCSILEIGAGYGDLARLFIQAGYHDYTAVEPNPTMRDRLAALGVGTRDYLIPHLAEADASYDVVILINVFEHMNGPQEAQTFMEEAWRVLRPSGMLVLAAPDYLHWQSDFHDCDPTHNNVTTLQRTLALLYNQGFQTRQQVYFSGPIAGPLATPLSYIARLGFFWVPSVGWAARLGRLKRTFLRRFQVVAQKPPA